MPFFDRNKLMQDQTPNASRPPVLLVDDESSSLAALRGVLGSVFEVTCANSADEALALSSNVKEWAAIVSDYRMPKVNGVQLLERLAEQMPRARRILLTGYVDIESVIDSINRAQIWKFMVKPYDRDDLRLTVQRAVEAYQMQCQLDQHVHDLEREVAARTQELAQRNQELEAALVEIHNASRTDSLTGLRNRRYFDDCIEAELALANSPDGHRELCLLLIDIDRFKLINDRHGHGVGDAVLRQVATCLSRAARPGDVVLRWGGEEFLVLARCLPRTQAAAYAERLRAAIGDVPMQLPAAASETVSELSAETSVDSTLAVSVSIGFACYPLGGELTGWSVALELADLALYQCKHHGRNAWAGLSTLDGWQALLHLRQGDNPERWLERSWNHDR